MDEYVFDMTPEEILRAYREAKDKDAQIRILADCNLCTAADVARFLRDQGEPLSYKWKQRLGKTAGQGNPAARRPSAFWNRVGEKKPPRFKPLLVSWGANDSAQLGISVFDGEIWMNDGYKTDAPDFWMRLPRPPHLEEAKTG